MTEQQALLLFLKTLTAIVGTVFATANEKFGITTGKTTDALKGLGAAFLLFSSGDKL